ncbi:MAG: hypothetical protein ACOVQT_15360 [Rubrivivax sp.]|jgi:hypothetical protein
MPSWSELTMPLQGEALAALRTHWRWRLGERWQPLLASVLGDVFVELPAGSVWWLSTATGDLEQVAPSRAAFVHALQTDRIDEWLLPGLVAVLLAQGKRLLPGQCYTFATLPVFEEGRFEAENLFVVDAASHFAATAEVHRRLLGLPDGTAVRWDETEPPGRG